eukprot:9119227-Pyramimonas_sp.AAC.1
MSYEAARTHFGTPSLRSGGATLVAAENVSGRVFQHHGGWRDPSCKDRYVADSLEHRLKVTQAMLRGGAECAGGVDLAIALAH